MKSNESIIARHCDEVAQAVQQIRQAFRSSSTVKTSTLLDRFWTLQDHLHRLVAMLSDYPEEISSVSQKYSSLTSDVLDLLSFASKTSVGRLPAVVSSCQAIQDLLFELQNLKHSPLVGSA